MPHTPIVLDRAAAEPLYRQIELQLRSSILDGRLRPGTALPGIRTLSRQLGVARNTVIEAYEQLIAEGFLVAHVGTGTRVADSPPAAPVARGVAASSLDAGEGRRPEANPWVPVGPPGESAPVRPAFPADFRPATEAGNPLSAEAWTRELQAASRELGSDAGRAPGHGVDVAGDRALREVLAAYLGAARAVRCDPGQVVITTGLRSSVSVAGRVWLRPGRTCVVEDPTDPAMRRALSVSGARLRAVPVDRHGISVRRLPAEATMVHVTPSWQFPSGGTLPLERREALLRWASEAGALILEDDREGEIRYAGPSLPCLQGLDREGRVIYVGGFRRLMLPGLDTGYAVLPPDLVDPYVALIDSDGQTPGVLGQRALARFIENGSLDRHLRRLRSALGERQAALVDALSAELSGLLAPEPAPAAGTHLRVTVVDRAWTARAVAAAAERAGIGLVPLDGFRTAAGTDRELVMAYGARTTEQIRDGIARLATLLRPGAATRSEGVGASFPQLRRPVPVGARGLKPPLGVRPR